MVKDNFINRMEKKKKLADHTSSIAIRGSKNQDRIDIEEN